MRIAKLYGYASRLFATLVVFSMFLNFLSPVLVIKNVRAESDAETLVTTEVEVAGEPEVKKTEETEVTRVKEEKEGKSEESSVKNEPELDLGFDEEPSLDEQLATSPSLSVINDQVTETLKEAGEVTEAEIELNVAKGEEKVKKEEKVGRYIWQKEGDFYKTDRNVEVGVLYQAPQNPEVSVMFTKLPEKTSPIYIKELKLSREEVRKLNAVGDVAYDIKANMENGAFEYVLTLPSGEVTDAIVKYSETERDLYNKAKVVEGHRVYTGNKVVVAGVNHFTIFVVINPNPVSSDCSNAGFPVSIGDKCYNTIPDAINNASVGDVIAVADGTYSGNINLDKSVILRAQNTNGAKIVCTNPAGNGINVNTSNASIEGFDISGCSNGIRVSNSRSNLNIANNVVHNNSASGLVFENRCFSVSVSNNHIYSNGGRGIYVVSNGTMFSFENNRVAENGMAGILGDNSLDNSRIVNNIVANNAGRGIRLVDANSNLITGNVITGNVTNPAASSPKAGLVLEGASTGNTINGNIFNNPGIDIADAVDENGSNNWDGNTWELYNLAKKATDSDGDNDIDYIDTDGDGVLDTNLTTYAINKSVGGVFSVNDNHPITSLSDTNGPTVAITNPSDGAELYNLVDVRGTVNDPNIKEYTLTIIKNSDNSVVATVTGNNNIVDAVIVDDWNTSTLEAGNYTITLTAIDTLGHTSTTSITVSPDRTAPTTPKWTNMPKFKHNGNTELMTWTPSTDTNGILRYEYQYVRKNLITNTVVNGSANIAGTASSWNPTTEQDSMWIFRIRAVDKAGNKSAWSNWNDIADADFNSSLNFSYSDYINRVGVFGRADYDAIDGGTLIREDNSPFSSINSPSSPLVTNNATVALGYFATDIDTAVKNVDVYASFNGGAAFLISDNHTSGSNVTLTNGDGRYCLYTVAEDIADDGTADAGVGNVEVPSNTCQLEVFLDTVPPTSVLDLEGVLGGNTAQCDPDMTEGGWKHRLDDVAGKPTVCHGWYKEFTKVEFKLDPNVDPFLNGEFINYKVVGVTETCGDTGYTQISSITNIASQVNTYGEHKICYYAEDPAGNKEDIKEKIVRVDSVNDGSITFTTNETLVVGDKHYFNTNDLVIDGTARDSENGDSGLKRFRMLVWNTHKKCGDAVNVLKDQSSTLMIDKDWNMGETATNKWNYNLPDGEYCIELRTRDAAFNVNSKFFKVVVDTTIPEVDKLEDKTYNEGDPMEGVSVEARDDIAGLSTTNVCIKYTNDLGQVVPLEGLFDVLVGTAATIKTSEGVCPAGYSGLVFDLAGSNSTPKLSDTFFVGDDMHVDTSVLPEGTYDFKYWVTDVMGRSSNVEEVKYTINNVAPTINSFVASDTSVKAGDWVNFTASFTDPAEISGGNGNIGIPDDSSWLYSFDWSYNGTFRTEAGPYLATKTGNLVMPSHAFPSHTEGATVTYKVAMRICESAPTYNIEGIKNTIWLDDAEKESGEGACTIKTVAITVESPAPYTRPGGTDEGGLNAGATGEVRSENAESIEKQSPEVLGVRTCDVKTQIKLSGYVFNDVNRNNIKDEGEKVYSNVDVKVYYYDENNRRVDVATVKTDTNGYYQTKVCPGEYKVEVDTSDLPKNLKPVNGQIKTVTATYKEGDLEGTSINFEFVEDSGTKAENRIFGYWWILLIMLLLGVLVYVVAKNKNDR